MFRSFKYRLYPNGNQERELGIMLETHRRIWNSYLVQRIAAWECDRVSVSYFAQNRYWTADRRTNQYYARLNSHSVKHTLLRLDKAFKSFFHRREAGDNPGLPRFKGKGAFRSVEFTYLNGVRLSHDRLRVQYVGSIRVNVHRPCQGVIKNIRLRFAGGKWYVILACDLGDVLVAKSTLQPAGVDVGIRDFLVTSDGCSVANPRFYKCELPRLRRLNRSMDRKNKRGRNREKARKLLSRAHERVANLRREYHHKTALDLVRRYGLIAVESLNIRGMVKSRRFARSILDAGWYSFRSILNYKAENAGVEVVAVDASYTSQLCSACGAMVEKDLKERMHNCPHCGCSLQRDVNAARNILARALVRTEPAGRNAGDTPHVPRSQRRKAKVKSQGGLVTDQIKNPSASRCATDSREGGSDVT